jgi:hypothetical protein
LLYDSGDSPSTYDHASIDRRFNKLQSEMRDMSTATDDKLRGLGDKLTMEVNVLGDNLAVLGKELSMENKILRKELSMEIKNLGTTMDARFETMVVRFRTSDAKTQSKIDALRIELKDREARFWALVVFPVSGLLCICYILPSNNAKVVVVASLASSAAFLQYQTPAIQTPAIQTPAVQTPAVQAPAVGQK